MTTLQFHNTLSGKKEPLKLLKQGRVGLYVCGITPYDEPHLGHARCYVVFDILKRVLKRSGLKVRHIQNFTDVDDKIIERANGVKKPCEAYVEPLIKSFLHWMEALNIEPADAYPRVTTSMPIIIKLIERLVKKGMAYEKGGSVFFSVRKFKPYGKLSKRKLDDLEVGARVEVNEEKNDPLDFALWKKSKENEPSWDSPWGKGRPGWHIECSAMSMDALGETFDIHGGGQDLIFPHHENEIAQANGATGKETGFAKFWIHNGFVTINKEKMSKSLGNFFTIKDILSKYDAMSVRYFLLSQHYRSPLNFSDQELATAHTTWSQRIVGAYEKVKGEDGKDTEEREEFVKSFHAALQNDLNTPAALGSLNQFCSSIFQDEASAGKKTKAQFDDMLETLGLKIPQGENWDAEILKIVHEREAARKNKEWAKSDQLRDELKKRGVLVEDTAQGSKLKPV